MGGIIVLGASLVLLTFPWSRRSAPRASGLGGPDRPGGGIAAKPVFGNLIAGLQIAVTQPIRLDDVVIVEGDGGASRRSAAAMWWCASGSERRMVVPLTLVHREPLPELDAAQRRPARTAFLWLDYRAPVAAIRAELERICRGEALWDGPGPCVTQVTETSERAIQVRLLVSARSSGDAFDLRCLVRERMLDFLAREHPQSLPQVRARLQHADELDMPRGPRARTADVRSPGAEDGEAGDRAGGAGPERYAGRWPASSVLPASGRHYRKQDFAALPELTARRRRSGCRCRSAAGVARGCAVRRRSHFDQLRFAPGGAVPMTAGRPAGH